MGEPLQNSSNPVQDAIAGVFKMLQGMGGQAPTPASAEQTLPVIERGAGSRVWHSHQRTLASTAVDNPVPRGWKPRFQRSGHPDAVRPAGCEAAAGQQSLRVTR